MSKRLSRSWLGNPRRQLMWIMSFLIVPVGARNRTLALYNSNICFFPTKLTLTPLFIDIKILSIYVIWYYHSWLEFSLPRELLCLFHIIISTSLSQQSFPAHTQNILSLFLHFLCICYCSYIIYCIHILCCLYLQIYIVIFKRKYVFSFVIFLLLQYVFVIILIMSFPEWLDCRQDCVPLTFVTWVIIMFIQLYVLQYKKRRESIHCTVPVGTI